MSASQHSEFDRRMRRITRRHTQLSRGYVTSVNDDGLVVAKPKRKFSRGTLRGIAIVVVMLMLFKAVLFSQLGASAYGERINALNEGSFFEKAGAVFMSADPITVWLAGKIGGYL
ncbi:MAG: hypothetical protein AAF718_08320 [Pseudomonadota bacterium]